MSDQPREYPPEFYARLLFYAEADLWNAEQSLQQTSGFWHIPCFAARESAEKTLKAFLEAAGKSAPTLHGLSKLLQDCMAVDKEFGRFQLHVKRLARYQTDARYPDEAKEYDFTAEEATEAVRLARELFDTVRDKIERRKRDGLL
ncbi:MAG: HEPN domain-containing protein [Abditibacteriales bacterium]|nr:HEPN domain-containing protein [Abditibacteriales bacterium]MDW8368297.1 HEPN domain-containing protein [Abditibacteriales bacterium]